MFLSHCIVLPLWGSMERKFTHYLITRFNINGSGYVPEYISPGLITPQWMETRMLLFETFCAPSVLKQSCLNFTWLIYVDSHTNEYSLARIRTITQSIGDLLIIPVTDFSAMLADIRWRCLQSGTAFVITTRLDNDDGVGITFIEHIQDAFIPQDKTVVNLLGGVNYHTKLNILTYHRYSLRNSFLSIIEHCGNMGDMLTVYGFRHLVPPRETKIINVKSRYAFWMTLHDKNAAIRKNLGWPVSPAMVMKHYGISPVAVPISLIETSLYTLAWLPQALFRKLKYVCKTAISRISPQS